MDKRRTTRGRSKRAEDVELSAAAAVPPPTAINALTKRNIAAPASAASKSSPSRRASPARRPSRSSPVQRRSSRPRSTVLGSSATTGSVTISAMLSPSPINEKKLGEEVLPDDEEDLPLRPKSRNNLPTTLTTNTSSRAPGKINLTSSVHSSYSSTTQKTLEIRSSTATIDSEVAKLTDYLRRSVSKTFSITHSREATHTPSTTTGASRNSRSVSQSIYNDENYFKEAEFSDNEESDAAEEHFKSFNATTTSAPYSSVTCRKIEAPREFGGFVGVTFLMLFIPSAVYYLQWCCFTSSGCKLMMPDFSDTLNIHFMADLFQTEALMAYLGFNMSVFLLSAIMFGRFVRLANDRQSQTYNFNALPIAVLLMLIGGIGSVYFKYPLADFVLKHYLRFCFYGMANAFIVATWAFYRSKYLREENALPNVYGRSGNAVIDFALGRQINPKWLGLVEFKQVFYRMSLLATLLFAVCFVYKSVHIPSRRAMIISTNDSGIESLSETIVSFVQFYYRNVQYEPTALLSAAFLLCYVMDAIIFEHHLASSFELQGEGFGALLLLRYAATPFVHSAVAKYFIDRRIGNIACRYGVYVAIAVFFIGMFVKRISSAIKYKYRIDPNNKLFKGVETIHTFQGRRLILGSFWGRLRQPNYTGDIMALCGMTVPLFLRFAWPPAMCIMLCIALLLHRSMRVNARNFSRYHSSWVRYCSKVRNYIIPKVF